MPVMYLQPSALACLAVAIFSSSCGVSSGPTTRQRSERTLYKWYDDGGSGKVTVRISLTDQIAEFKRGERDVGWCYVATGKEGHDTRPGSYTITEKIVDKHSGTYGWMEDGSGNVTSSDAKSSDKVPAGMVYVPAPMPYWMRLTSYGVGMHSGIIPEPGQPASHGCIRMPKDFVPTLYENVVVGTPVTITNESSTQGPNSEGQTPHEMDSGAPQVAGRAWTPNGATPQSAQSVTYRNGLPVFYQ